MSNQITKTDQELAILAITNQFYFTELVERYEKPLMRYIKRLGYFELTETEDVLQDAFLKVYRNLNAYNPDLKFSSWIYRITHNVTMDFLRKKSVRPEGHYAVVDEQFIDRVSSDFATDNLSITSENADAVTSAIYKLPIKYRDPVILYYFENKTYEEIGDVLKIPPNTVATRLSRAKTKLKLLLTKE